MSRIRFAALSTAVVVVITGLAAPSIARAAPLTYYFETPDFEKPLPAGLPSDDPGFCDDNIRHATTNCGVSFVSFMFTIDSDDIVPGGNVFHAPVTDWWIFDGVTLASEGTEFGMPPLYPFFRADDSGMLTSFLVKVTSTYLPLVGHFDQMTINWNSVEGVLLLGRYCVAPSVICNDGRGSEEVPLRAIGGGTLTLAQEVPEPAPLFLLASALAAYFRRR